MNVHIQNNIAQQQRAYIARQHNRAILRLQLSNGVRELIKRPWKLAPLLALVVLFVIAWNHRGKVAFTTAIPAISAAWTYAVEILIVLLGALSILGLLALLGAPYVSFLFFLYLNYLMKTFLFSSSILLFYLII